jgi:hypothetical protein
MAFVPNVWGLWNLLYAVFFAPRHVSLGIIGGFAPSPTGAARLHVAHLLQFPIPPHVLQLAPIGLPIGMILYYLAWKYLVGSRQCGTRYRLIPSIIPSMNVIGDKDVAIARDLPALLQRAGCAAGNRSKWLSERQELGDVRHELTERIIQ